MDVPDGFAFGDLPCRATEADDVPSESLLLFVTRFGMFTLSFM